jgi:hypothetical protein
VNITREMLQAATRKAVELKLLPRHVFPEDLATNEELIQEILEAAFEAAPQESETAQEKRNRASGS